MKSFVSSHIFDTNPLTGFDWITIYYLVALQISFSLTIMDIFLKNARCFFTQYPDRHHKQSCCFFFLKGILQLTACHTHDLCCKLYKPVRLWGSFWWIPVSRYSPAINIYPLAFPDQCTRSATQRRHSWVILILIQYCSSLFPPFSHSAIAGLFIVFLSVKYHTQNSVLPYSYGGVRQHSYISTAINHAACPAAFHSPEERLTCGPSARCHSQKPPQVCKGLKAQSTAQNNLCLMRRLKIIWLGCFLTKPIR